MKGKQITSQNGVIDRNVASQFRDQEYLSVAYGVTRIANVAFINCRYLREIYLPPTIEKIGFCAFPENVTIIIDPCNSSYEIVKDEFIYEIDSHKLISFVGKIGGESYRLINRI